MLRTLYKVCPACKKSLPVNEFYLNYRTKDKLFSCCKICHKKKTKDRRSTEKGFFKAIFLSARSRAKKSNLPFNLDEAYLKSIKTDKCPIFGFELSWFEVGNGLHDKCPSLDRVVPEFGYVKHNVVFISHLANKIKQDVTETELYKVADWLHDKRKEVLNVIKEQPTPIPTKHTGKSKTNSTLGVVHGTRIGKDCDGSLHHRGESEGQNLGHSPQASCRICLGTGVQKLGASPQFEMWDGDGNAIEQTESVAKRFGCVCYQS